MTKNMLILALLVALTGCAEIRSIRQAVGLYGAEASDQALDTAIWQICYGSPIGAINRRFKTDPEKQAWQAICPVQ